MILTIIGESFAPPGHRVVDWTNRGLELVVILLTSAVAYRQRLSDDRHALASSESQRVAEQFLHQLDSASFGKIIIDRDGTIIFLNDSFNKTFGYDEGELLGQKIECVIPDSFRKSHVQQRTDFFLDPRPRLMTGQLEVDGRHKSGRTIPVTVALAQIMTSSGPAALATVVDVSAQAEIRRQLEHRTESLKEQRLLALKIAKDAEDARKRAEESERRLERAIAGTSDGLWEWDIEKDHFWFAPRFAELLGYERDTLPYTFDFWKSQLHPDDKEKMAALVESCLCHDRPFDLRCRLKKNSGEYHWYRWRGAAIRCGSGQARLMAGSLQDIDELVQAEQLIEQQATEAGQNAIVVALNDASRAVTSAGSIQEAVQTITDKARQIVGTHCASMALVDGNASARAHAISLSDEYVAQGTAREFLHDSSRGLWSLVRKHPIRLTRHEIENHADLDINDLQLPGNGCLLAPLLTNDGEIFGMLQLTDKLSDDFTEVDEALVNQFANMAAIVLQLRELNDNLEDAVQERTAELETANVELAREIEARTALRDKLVTASRQAGMAEVATGVLHNVGNVLNSVNVSANILVERVQNSRIQSLMRASEVISQHAEDLGTFLTEDAKGKHFPELLGKLATNLSDERDNELKELQSLIENIEHIKEVVNMQQSYAKVCGATEPVDMVGLVEDSLKINDSGLIRHSVDVSREFTDVPLVVTEKHKVLLILVNLISNAKYAVSDNGRDHKRITLCVSSDEQGVSVQVRDNGVGIPRENLTRIFSHGFTTKKDGHGFGLHSSALSAQELGGTLTVQSDGPGKGATFTLRLPLEKEALCTIQ